jgi:hypothetical protein
MEQPKKPIVSKRTPNEWRDWSDTKDRIGEQLRQYYQGFTTEELPPRLMALLKKLDEEAPSADQSCVGTIQRTEET